MAFTGITLSGMNAAVRDLPLDWRIQPDEKWTFPILDFLRPRMQTREFSMSGHAQIYIELGHPVTGQAFGEDMSLPYPDTVSGQLMLVPLRQMIVTAGVTHDALFRLTGKPGAWLKAVVHALELRAEDWDWLLERTLLGAGNGSLGTIAGCLYTAATQVTTIYFDNTYHNFGWEGVDIMRKGDQIEIYQGATNTPAGLSTQVTGASSCTTWKVLSVVKASRNNGAALTGANCGYITVSDPSGTLCSALTTGTSSSYAACSGVTNPTVFAAGTQSVNQSKSFTDGPIMPVGLLGHIQNGVAKFGVNDLGVANSTGSATYQSLVRPSYESLQSTLWDATNFGGSGAVAGTPTDWDLSDITDMMDAIYQGSSSQYPDLLLCNSKLAMAIVRRQKAESGITVQVGSGTAQYEDARTAVGGRYAGWFTRPDGVKIPIGIGKTLPPNVLWMPRSEDLIWHALGGFFNWAPVLGDTAQPGDVWMKSAGDRKTNFEAPFGGYMQITGQRCDSHGRMQDLADDI